MSSRLHLNKLLLGILGLQLTVVGGAVSIATQYGSPWEILLHVGVLVTVAAFFAPATQSDDTDSEPTDDSAVFASDRADGSENTD